MLQQQEGCEEMKHWGYKEKYKNPALQMDNICKNKHKSIQLK